MVEMGTIIPILATLLIAAGSICAQAADSRVFWEPDLPQDQSFLTLWRSIKAFALTHYDIVQDDESYPVTELTVELTHGVVLFMHIGESTGKREPLSLKEIAEGKYGENNSLERWLPGNEPPKELTLRGPDPLRHVRFGMKSANEVTLLYRELNQRFKTAFPW